MKPRAVTPADTITPAACACDFAALTIEARLKLEALAFLLSQAKVELSADDDVFHGLALILRDVRATLEPKAGVQ